MTKPFTWIAVAFLVLVCLLHLARVGLGVVVTVGGTEVPVWMSIPGALFTGALAVLVAREVRQ